jgi:hypothetical protein
MAPEPGSGTADDKPIPARGCAFSRGCPGSHSRSKVRQNALTCSFFGVSDGIRTHDIQDHNLAL